MKSLCLLDDHDWHEKLAGHWLPGEDRAYELLDMFIDNSIDHYEVERDVPSIDARSRLSPYLHFGEITPLRIYFALWPLIEGERDVNSTQSAEVFSQTVNLARVRAQRAVALCRYGDAADEVVLPEKILA